MTFRNATALFFAFASLVTATAEQPTRTITVTEPVFRVVEINPCNCADCVAEKLAKQQAERYGTTCRFPVADPLPNYGNESVLLQFEMQQAKVQFNQEFGHEWLKIGETQSPLLQFETEQAKAQFSQEFGHTWLKVIK